MKRIAVISKHSPFNSNQGQEALDAVLAMASYEQDVSMFFIEDGVWQLLKGQQPELKNSKDYLATLKALPFYDVEDLYVCTDALARSGLSQDELLDDVSPIEPGKIQSELAEFDVILEF